MQARSLSIMREGREKHFDPELLDMFLDSLDEVFRIRRAFPDEVIVGAIDADSKPLES